MLRTIKQSIFALTALVSVSANASIILSTDFNDRVVAGNTASNLNWVANGVTAPGDLSANFNLFDTTDSQNRFFVDSNIVNENPWIVDIGLSVLSDNLSQLMLSLDAFILNNAGALQSVQRNLDLTASIFDSNNVLMMSVSMLDIYANNGAFTASNPNGSTVMFDFSGLTLQANSDYSLRLFAEGQGNGNNAGFDNFELAGEASASPSATVPEPSALALISLGLVFVGMRRRIRRAS